MAGGIKLAFDVEKKDLIASSTSTCQGNQASYRGIYPGVNIQGRCQTSGCEAAKDGMSIFTLPDDSQEGDVKVVDLREAEWECKLCKKPYKLDKVLFYGCEFNVHWKKRLEDGSLHPKKKEPRAQTGFLKADSNGKFYQFAAGELVEYTEFIIKWKRS